MNQLDPQLISDFQSVLEEDNENKCQVFLEKNTELIYTPYLLNHWLHMVSVISKFPIDTSLITDFAYLTKGSDQWRLVLVELEKPGKQLF